MNRREIALLLVGAVVAVLGIGGTVALADARDPSQASCAGGRMHGMHRMHAMHGMMRHARVRGEADYLATMVEHHREAIRSARALTRSDRPEMRRFGREIVRAQSHQVRQMRRWLARWYPDQPVATYQPMMRDLTGLSGSDLDRAFLQDMVGHHMAAVMMSQWLLARDLVRHPSVTRLAENIRDTQHDEIRQMQVWYADWFAGSAAPSCR